MKAKTICRVLAVYDPSKTLQGMAAESGLSYPTIKSALIALGKQPAKARRGRPRGENTSLPPTGGLIAARYAEEHPAFLAAWDPDKTWAKMADELDWAESRVKNHADLDGLKINRKSPVWITTPPGPNRLKAVELFDQGMNCSRIAEVLRVSRERACQYIRKDRPGVMETRREESHWRPCRQCSTPIDNRESVSRYCSQECLLAYRAAHKKPKQMVALKCDGCGKDFLRPMRIHRIHIWQECKQTFCTQPCYLKHGNMYGWKK